jgi:hypothetical protein
VKPEEALAAAREAAAAARARGSYGDDLAGFAIEPTDRITSEQLVEWAVIEPDTALVRSTRRAGAPVTWVKKVLMRGLQQYHNELTAQQTRFNLNLLAYVAELEDRVKALEDSRERPPGP